MTHDLDDLMDFAVRTAAGAGDITRARFGSAMVEYKSDGSEVTEADRAAESFIRETIAAAYPEHGIFGEEEDEHTGAGEYRWIVDPIDGTRSFASGVPLYGVLLALEHRGVPIVGCAHFPELGETVVAARGAGCWWGDRRARVSDRDSLADARVVTSGLEYWRDWGTDAGKAGFDRLLAGARFGRTWGDCFGYVLVATGRVEILADPACGALWDYAPIVPIIEEAGGRFTNLLGQPVTAWSTALAANAELHAQAVACWGGLQDDDAIQTDAVRSRRRP